MKKLSVFLALAILLSVFTVFASAAQNDEVILPAPTVWFKPEGLSSYENGASVTKWEDASGNGWNAGPRVGASIPTPAVKKNGLNGYPVLSYTGGQVLTFTNAAIGANTQYTIVAVYRATGAEATSMILRTNNHGIGLVYSKQYGCSVTAGGYKFLGAANSKSVGTAEKFHIDAVTWDIASGALKYYHDGYFASELTRTYTPVPATDKNGQTYIGGDWTTAGSYLTGEIAEIRVYSTVLSNSDLDGVGSDLADKFGLTWARRTPDPKNADKPVVWFKPENLSSYNNGESVTIWEDASGNGWNAAQRINTTVPTPKVKTDGLNGYPVLSYTGKENLTFNNASIGQNTQYTAYVVCRSTGTATSMILRTHNAKGFGLTYMENKYGASTTAGGWKFFGAAGSATAGESEGFHIMCVTWDTISGKMAYYHDGVLSAEHTATYTTPAAADYQNQVHMGGDWSSGGNYFTGEIAEVMIFDSVLPASVLDNFGSDLADKFDITWTRSTIDERSTLLEYYLVTAPTVAAGGLFNQRSYKLDLVNGKTIVNPKVKSEDMEISFSGWYLRTMVQSKTGENGKLDVRFISMLDENIEDYEEAGFEIDVGTTKVTVKTTEANTSFISDGETVSIGDYSEENDYFFLAKNVFASEVVAADPEITVTPYVSLADGTQMITGQPITFHLSELTK